MSYLQRAKELKEDYDWQITFEDYENQECFKELIKRARQLRTTIVGVCILKQYKEDGDQEAVKILDVLVATGEGEGNDK